MVRKKIGYNAASAPMPILPCSRPWRNNGFARLQITPCAGRGDRDIHSIKGSTGKLVGATINNSRHCNILPAEFLQYHSSI